MCLLETRTREGRGTSRLPLGIDEFPEGLGRLDQPLVSLHRQDAQEQRRERGTRFVGILANDVFNQRGDTTLDLVRGHSRLPYSSLRTAGARKKGGRHPA